MLYRAYVDIAVAAWQPVVVARRRRWRMHTQCVVPIVSQVCCWSSGCGGLVWQWGRVYRNSGALWRDSRVGSAATCVLFAALAIFDGVQHHSSSWQDWSLAVRIGIAVVGLLVLAVESCVASLRYHWYAILGVQCSWLVPRPQLRVAGGRELW